MRGPSKSARLVPRPPRRPWEEEPQHRAADSNLGSRLPTEWQRCRPSFSTASPPGRPLRSGPGRNLVLHPKADRNRASTPTQNRIPRPGAPGNCPEFPHTRETERRLVLPALPNGRHWLAVPSARRAPCRSPRLPEPEPDATVSALKPPKLTRISLRLPD